MALGEKEKAKALVEILFSQQGLVEAFVLTQHLLEDYIEAIEDEDYETLEELLHTDRPTRVTAKNERKVDDSQALTEFSDAADQKIGQLKDAAQNW